MRSPDHRQGAPPRAGTRLEDELQLHYLAPGAFTVLPPERRHSPESPPPAPEPYRLTPGTKRRKQPSFAIIGDLDCSTPAPPSGRVSPFKGRGFNPLGSRHASPSPPPPENAPVGSSPSRIPLPRKKGGSGVGGQRPGVGGRLGDQLSHSLSDLDKEAGRRDGRSSRRHAHDKASGFQRLSPIMGSSPEPSQSMSSPSRIPRSQSTPPSRKPSPSRYTSPTSGKPPLANSSVARSRSQSRIRSRNASRNPSRTASREASPTKATTSPSRIPLSKYKNVQAKVDTNNKPKPKVLPKPEVSSEQSDSEPAKSKLRTPLSRKESFNRMRTDSRPNLLPKTGNYGKNNYNSTSDSSVGAGSARDPVKVSTNKNNASIAPSNSSSVITKGNISKRDQVSDNITKEPTTNSDSSNSVLKKSNTSKRNQVSDSNTKEPTTNSDSSNSVLKKGNTSKRNQVSDSNTKEATTNSDSSNTVRVNPNKPDDSETSGARSDKNDGAEAQPPTNEVTSKPAALPSTATAVSSTTSTVAKPLKIETNLSYPDLVDKPHPRSPMIDGRVLSATSVSNAMNKMNDTVLDTQTLMRDRGFSKLSPAANAVIAVANETSKSNAALDTKNATSALPKVEPLPKSVEKTTPKSNHNGRAKQIEHVLSSKDLELEVQKHMQRLITPERRVSSNGRSVVTSDVQPIQITVREKPSDAEVQSGNVRHVNVSNGISARPGLPPQAQATPPSEPEKDPPPSNACLKWLASCRSNRCSSCARRPAGTVGCLACLRKKPAPATIVIENEMDGRRKLLDRLGCCKSQRVADASCFPKGRRKESWGERRDSISGAATPPKSNSKNFMRKMFCLDRCCKRKGIEEIVRKPSIMSKKKSLTPTTAPPPEEPSPKIDLSLVEHSSHMKAAIPILPICLAWFCLVMNCIAPGSGTVFSGIFCLCMGIPRFSQKDGARPRIGSFLINIIIGIGQFFTVLFCLVGWGWSIWWGVIMVKIAKKHKKFKHLEAIEQASSMSSINPNNRGISQQRRS